MTADEAYVRRSILEPNAQVTEGFAPTMPTTFGDILSDQDLDALVAYIASLGGVRAANMTTIGDAHGGRLTRYWLVLSLLLLALAPSCSGEGRSATAPANAAFANPLEYCEVVGDIDRPDERYFGEAVPATIAQGIRIATGTSAEAPLEFITRGTSWRCMNGAVYACTVGANLPCEEKADTSRDASPQMDEYCATNTEADVIPAAVTGRATVYAWFCDGSEAVVERQVFHVDDRGFLADIWYRLESP